ncbi:DDB1- and CUL4-associated factor 10 homolog [Corticium candelabrum]|uniref:DDB1- and CUL4-associated factor 10 homolog n=1 Tax=Corticium candelabrum TaxID=121492 RepID=UPI002E25B2FC|nr:DDB1- and CUL4-associated factor 10 homolog [Corticium candelabrum]
MGSISIFQKVQLRSIGGHFSPSSQTAYLYRSMRSSGHWEYEEKSSSPYGSVFGLDFSPRGDVVIAACEKNSILMFDPYTHRCVKAVGRAHNDCVNGVRFLDHRTFLTCSDDMTIALWDIRNVDQKVTSLEGHTGWVKSIEYSYREKMVVTTGFDNTVRVWETNTFSDDYTIGYVVFTIQYSTRLKLTSDDNKMVIATSVGLILVIHKLSLTFLQEDMRGFNPLEVWMAHRDGDRRYTETLHFQHNRNRVQFISDYLPDMYPWSINSIEIHPKGKCVLSRFVSEEFNSEWTTIHALETKTDDNRSLLWYTEEANRERDYIKEICFSADGRVACSPFAYGIRLFSPTVDCDVFTEPEEFDDMQPTELVEINSVISHKNVVLTTKFSPVHMLFVSGCLGGRVCFSQPHLA